jgi:hypothetical protein
MKGGGLEICVTSPPYLFLIPGLNKNHANYMLNIGKKNKCIFQCGEVVIT